jgi:hypothetical protein
MAENKLTATLHRLCLNSRITASNNPDKKTSELIGHELVMVNFVDEVTASLQCPCW